MTFDKTPVDFATYQKQCQVRVDAALEQFLRTARGELQRLYQAMHYSVINGGKRVRPMLVYAACEALDGDPERAQGAACAVEMIHAYSLVHDDLPAMDDDDLRRGRLTTHKAFDEACAILVGDGLQALAFEALSDDRLNPGQPELRMQMVGVLARAVGPAGLVGGQAIDLEAVGHQLDQSALEVMHRHKTGALIEACVQLGALASGNAQDSSLRALREYARAVGLAFQVQDDILDVESDTATLGKRQGADIAHDKPTYPALIGLEAAKHYARVLHDQALSALHGFDQGAEPLRALARFIVERRH
ncbi:MAG: polyprenyl synthetase family protein [Pseudomonas sp.]